MDLLPLFQWFESTLPGTVVRESLWLFPVIECIHLLALSLLGGCVLLLDLRLLGFGLRSQTPAMLECSLHPWMASAVFAMIVTGILMFLSEAIKCFYSPPFWVKIGMLVVAVLFTFTIRRRVAQSAEAGSSAVRLTAAASVGLWFGVAFCGRWIAFY